MRRKSIFARLIDNIVQVILMGARCCSCMLEDKDDNISVDTEYATRLCVSITAKKSIAPEQILKIPASGLPNLGNTCYLNSIIQLLYSVSLLRKQVVKLGPVFDIKSCHNHLYKVFRALDQNSDNIVKKVVLSELLEHLEQIEPYFDWNSQMDVRECFSVLFNALCQENPALSNLFKLSIIQKCKCKDSIRTLSHNCFRAEGRELCMECKQTIRHKLSWISPDILYIHKEGQLHETLAFKIMDGKKIVYRLMALVCYIRQEQGGGHYVTYRRKDFDKWVLINDGYTTQSRSLKPIGTSYLSFYQANDQPPQ